MRRKSSGGHRGHHSKPLELNFPCKLMSPPIDLYERLTLDPYPTAQAAAAVSYDATGSLQGL